MAFTLICCVRSIRLAVTRNLGTIVPNSTSKAAVAASRGMRRRSRRCMLGPRCQLNPRTIDEIAKQKTMAMLLVRGAVAQQRHVLLRRQVLDQPQRELLPGIPDERILFFCRPGKNLFTISRRPLLPRN